MLMESALTLMALSAVSAELVSYWTPVEETVLVCAKWDLWWDVVCFIYFWLCSLWNSDYTNRENFSPKKISVSMRGLFVLANLNSLIISCREDHKRRLDLWERAKATMTFSIFPSGCLAWTDYTSVFISLTKLQCVSSLLHYMSYMLGSW